MIFILKQGAIIHMNIGDNVKISIRKIMLYIMNNLIKIIICIFLLYFILVGFEVTAELICLLGRFNRIQSKICYNVVELIGFIIIFFIGITLQMKRHKFLKYFVIIILILAIYFTYNRYVFSKRFDVITINLLIYILYPFINCLLLLLGIVIGKLKKILQQTR